MMETRLLHEVNIRTATAADVPDITRIYNEGIHDRLATLETEERTPEERQAWLEARDERHPVLVAERGGTVAGWGSLNVFNPRPAYMHVVDFSIYVGREARGAGIGQALLAALIERARELGTTNSCWPRSLGTRPGCASTQGSASARSVFTANR